MLPNLSKGGLRYSQKTSQGRHTTIGLTIDGLVGGRLNIGNDILRDTYIPLVDFNTANLDILTCNCKSEGKLSGVPVRWLLFLTDRGPINLALQGF